MFKNIRKKLSNQLSFYIVLSVLSVFLIIGITTYIHMDNILEKRITSEATFKNRATSQDIRSMLYKASIITKQMGFNNEIRTYLKEVRTSDAILKHPLYKSILATLKSVHKSNSNNYIVWIANEKASFFIDSEGHVSSRDYIVSKRPWYKGAMQSTDISISPIYTDWKTKTNVTSSILTLRDPNEVYGFIAVDTSLDTIPLIYDNVDIGSKGKIFLITEKGKYLYKKDSTSKMESEVGSIYDFNDPLSNYANEIFEKKNGFQEIILDGEKWYLSYYTVTDNGWISIFLINKNETKEDLFSFTFVLLIIYIIAISILIFIIYYTISGVIEPIQTITRYGKQVSSGDFSHNLPTHFIDRDDEIGDLSRSFAIITDVFREKNMLLENRIRDKNDEIQKQYHYIIENEKLASLGTLVAGVAHEINTPIGVALTSSTYIQKLCDETRYKFDNNKLKKSDLSDFLNNLDESNKLLLDNIYRSANLIRRFKKIAVDQSSEDRSIFNVNDHIESIIVSLKHEYKNRNILIKNYCPSNLTLDGYPGAFAQIITNLIMNSLHHAYNGEKNNGLIIITAQKLDGFIEFHYTDDGSGISKSNLENIFEPFFTTNREDGNSGLGLHIVLNIVTKLLNGMITCDSDEGSGVHFTITIPNVII